MTWSWWASKRAPSSCTIPRTARHAGWPRATSAALAHGREERLSEAAAALDRAIALEPSRPEAWVERGGVRFLENRYEDAIADLSQALARGNDPYARDLLASALFLAGRTDAALAQWNLLGGPRLRTLSITGLERTKDAVARREISIGEGDMLGDDALRASQRRLEETQVFDQVTLRPIPRGDGQADLEVALSEQHGFFASPVEAVISAGVDALQERVRIRYANGLEAFRGRQAYTLDDGLGSTRRGFELSLRHVVDGRTVVQGGLRLKDRAFSAPRLDAPPGLIAGLEARVERRLLDGHLDRLDLAASAFRAAHAFGSDLAFTKAGFELSYQRHLSAPEQVRIEPSVLAVRLRLGWGGDGVPLDEMFAPGGSPDMELPLRAHRQTADGVLGATPIGRSLVLGNVEWRRRLIGSGPVPVGVVFFYDGAWVGRVADGRGTAFHDVGMGLRIGLPGSGIVRVDFGHGLTDGKNAIFVGLNQAF